MSDKPKKSVFKRWWFWALVIVVVVIIGSTAGKGGTTTSSTSSDQSTTQAAESTEEAKTTKTVEYRVEGTGKATSISYFTVDNGQSQQSQETDAALPWTKTVEISEGGHFNYQSLTLSAQAGASGGTITATILVDGEQVAQNSSSGAYAVVTVTGQAQ